MESSEQTEWARREEALCHCPAPLHKHVATSRETPSCLHGVLLLKQERYCGNTNECCALNYYYPGSDFLLSSLCSCFFTWSPQAARCSNNPCTKLKTRQKLVQIQTSGDTKSNRQVLSIDFPEQSVLVSSVPFRNPSQISQPSFLLTARLVLQSSSTIFQVPTNIKKGDKSTSPLITQGNELLTGIFFWLLLLDCLDLNEVILKVI